MVDQRSDTASRLSLRGMRFIVAAFSLVAALPFSGWAQVVPLRSSAASPSTVWNPWDAEHSGTDQPLRGIHAAGNGVAWASGARGTVLRTEDSGYVWQRCAMPEGAEKLDFRSIWAWDAQTAIVMSSGPGRGEPALQDDGRMRSLDSAGDQQ